MRVEVRRLAELGPFPSEAAASESDVAKRQALIEKIQEPLAEDEAEQLFALLGTAENSLFGLKWTLIQLLEGSPRWPSLVLGEATGHWQVFMRERAQRWLDKNRTTRSSN